MQSVRKPWWQQATALVTVSTGGVITGFTFVPGAAASMTSPSSVPMHLLALEKAAKPADTGDGTLRPAIVNVASYYLRLAQTRTPAQMEALIWGKDSVDGADHGESCAAFASLTLELAAQAVGQQSWVSGGGTYPWPLHEWADVRVNPNPDSLGITSIVQDAQAHQRWHPLGDGYQPQPGDWVVFDGHVEVVTSYSNGVLDSIGADSLPNFTVNAHSFPDPLVQQGVEGFVDNGHLGETTAAPPSGAPAAAATPAARARTSRGARSPAQPTLAAVPGVMSPTGGFGTGLTGPAASGSPTQSAASSATARAAADIPGAAVAAGLGVAAPHPSAAPTHTSAPYQQHAPSAAATPGTKTQQAFINQIASGAIAAQQRFGVPASVTIAQAIDESAWGTSLLAANDYNLFGIKGSGPAGSVSLPTQEFENGQWVTIYAQFRVYNNVAESIADHAELLATSGYYAHAMADRAVPDAFANDLTGVYATDPEYGSNLIALMRLYNLYRFDSPAASQPQAAAPSHTPSAYPSTGQPSGSQGSGARPSIPGILSVLSPALAGTPTPSTTHTPAPHPPGSELSEAQASIPGILSALAPAHSGTPTSSPSHSPASQPAAIQAPTPRPATTRPSTTQPSAVQPSSSGPSGAQPSIPGILSALSPTPTGTPAPKASYTPTAQPSATQTPTPQPTVAQPSASQTSQAQPSGLQSSGSEASVPGMIAELAGTPTPSVTASGGAGTPGNVPGHGGGGAPAGPARQRNSAVHANSAASQRNGAASVQGAAAVPGAGATAATSSVQPGSSATQADPTAVYGDVPVTGEGAAVPGAGAGGPASYAPQGHPAAYGTTAAYQTGTAPGAAAVPGINGPAPAPSAPRANATPYDGTVTYASSAATAPGAAAVPGVGATVAGFGVAGTAVRPVRRQAARSQSRSAARVPGLAAPAAIRYETPLPATVATAFFAKAKGPLARAEQLHRDVAGRAGIGWQLLAACDWMQCHADHTLSPVNGERLGKHNPDGTVYQTKSQALAQCASDLIYLAGAVYGLDLTARRALPVRALADVFAAFRWGGMLKRHGVSAMEFPYSVAGLTEQHLKMHWPVIDEPDAPDKQGSKFRGPFGAVPVLLSLNYPALV